MPSPPSPPSSRQHGAAKTRRIPIRIVAADPLPKPDWIRARAPAPSSRYVDPDTFARLRAAAKALGFAHAAAGPLVRSSYHADAQHAAADFDTGWLFGASDPPAELQPERQPFRAEPERPGGA